MFVGRAAVDKHSKFLNFISFCTLFVHSAIGQIILPCFLFAKFINKLDSTKIYRKLKKMRLRFGGIVMEIDRKGLTTILLLITLPVIIYLLSIYVSNQEQKFEQEYFPIPTPIQLPRRQNLRKEKIVISEDDESLPVELNDLEGNSQPEVLEEVKMAMGKLSRQKRAALASAVKSFMGIGNRPPDSHYSINVTLSDMTSLDRSIPDTRPPVCSQIKYNIKKLQKVSIVIPFFNEAPTMLLRNLHSILNRSPAELLEEIILVDDLSYDAPLKEPLDRYISLLPKVSMIRNDQRSGLIVCRMKGARAAKAPIVIFLDAHSEVNVGWLEPLVDELRRNPKQVIQPFIDGVDAQNLAFTSPPIYYKGAFSWDLRYTWLKLSDHEQQRAIETGEPFFTPTLVGCAIAVVKEYFFAIGSFDEGMYVWGGENLELAFRVWMCGGKATTVTCSRVGHVFKQSPNKFDGTKGTKEQTVQKNLIRVADVWMDGLRKYFYGTTLMFDFKRLRLTEEEKKSLRERSELRKNLKCQNFEWYLYNIIPEMNDLPPMESKYFGEIMNLHTRACWEVTLDYFIGMTYFCFEHKVIPKNNFALMANGMLMFRDKCIKIQPPKPYLLLSECPTTPEERERFGTWEVINHGVVWGGLRVRMKNEAGVVVHWCIVQVTNAMPEHKNEQMPQLGSCRDDDAFQMWAFTYAVDFTLVPEYLRLYQP